MSYSKSFILSLVFTLNAYVVSSQSKVVQAESGLLTLQISNENELYEHHITWLNGFDMIDYNISPDSTISIVYVPKKEFRRVMKDDICISVYKMVELNELYLKDVFSASFGIEYDDEKDLTFAYAESKELIVSNVKTKDKIAIDLQLKNEDTVVYRINDQVAETLKVKNTNWLIKKDGTVLDR